MFPKAYSARQMLIHSIGFQHYSIILPLSLILVALTLDLGTTQYGDYYNYELDCMDCDLVMGNETCPEIDPNCETGRYLCGCCDICRLTEGEHCDFYGPR